MPKPKAKSKESSEVPSKVQRLEISKAQRLESSLGFEIGSVYRKRTKLFLVIREDIVLSIYRGVLTEFPLKDLPREDCVHLRDMDVRSLCSEWGIQVAQLDAYTEKLKPPVCWDMGPSSGRDRSLPDRAILRHRILRGQKRHD